MTKRANEVAAGSRVRFQAPLSNGSIARWTARVVRVENGIAYVRHPEQARRFPFSPVPEKALYKYDVTKLEVVK